MFLVAPDLIHPGIAHGFFTRKSGVSEGLYASLNCGQGSSDNSAHIKENRRRVASALGAAPTHLCSLYQIHSADVITVTAPWLCNEKPKADAMVTSIPGFALGILTADCVPVLFADPHAAVIAAAHAGWKGAFAGILEQTIAAMTSLGAHTSRITAAIGPSIAQASYEVDVAFRDRFLHQNTLHSRYFIPGKRADHYLFDIKGYVREKLEKTGIAAINLLENDTYMEEDNFFSFRRTTHRGEPDYGRQISAIMLTR